MLKEAAASASDLQVSLMDWSILTAFSFAFLKTQQTGVTVFLACTLSTRIDLAEKSILRQKLCLGKTKQGERINRKVYKDREETAQKTNLEQICTLFGFHKLFI